jgi:hypothetical protein
LPETSRCSRRLIRVFTTPISVLTMTDRGVRHGLILVVKTE